jgi:hypothetical protein
MRFVLSIDERSFLLPRRAVRPLFNDPAGLLPGYPVSGRLTVWRPGFVRPIRLPGIGQTFRRQVDIVLISF